jgi:hypothetical protein
MLDPLRPTRGVHAALTLLVGTLAAAVLWLAGSPELSWLGFASAALGAGAHQGRCAARGRGQPRE